MKTSAVVPIKLNNERLPGKNIKMLGNKPLIQYILNTLLSIDNINNIYVYCSDESICEFLPEGIQFLRRPPILDLPTSNFNQIFDSFISHIESDIYVYTHATAPFLSVETIEECIVKVESEKYDSAFTALKIQDFLWMDEKPLNYNITNLPRSQDLKPIYRETSGVYVFTKECYLENRSRIGRNPYIKEVFFKESIDINNSEDFKLAQIILNI
jgi:CMP-N-acetylneuraminic acid synthetase